MTGNCKVLLLSVILAQVGMCQWGDMGPKGQEPSHSLCQLSRCPQLQTWGLPSKASLLLRQEVLPLWARSALLC